MTLYASSIAVITVTGHLGSVQDTAPTAEVCAVGTAQDRTSLRQYMTSAVRRRRRLTAGVRNRVIISSADGVDDAMLTCGGMNPDGSQPRMIGLRSAGSRAINAWRIAPTRAPDGSRSPHSSSVQVPLHVLITRYAAAVMPSSAMT